VPGINNNMKHYSKRKIVYIILYRPFALCQYYIVMAGKVMEKQHLETWQKVWYVGIINISLSQDSESRNILIIH
jgi:hypothetical protein